MMMMMMMTMRMLLMSTQYGRRTSSNL
eukprot:COSAG01_NODE_35200_length_535_cov_1.672018_1_plen_27_part_10